MQTELAALAGIYHRARIGPVGVLDGGSVLEVPQCAITAIEEQRAGREHRVAQG